MTVSTALWQPPVLYTPPLRKTLLSISLKTLQRCYVNHPKMPHVWGYIGKWWYQHWGKKVRQQQQQQQEKHQMHPFKYDDRLKCMFNRWFRKQAWIFLKKGIKELHILAKWCTKTWNVKKQSSGKRWVISTKTEVRYVIKNKLECRKVERFYWISEYWNPINSAQTNRSTHSNRNKSKAQGIIRRDENVSAESTHTHTQTDTHWLYSTSRKKLMINAPT